MASGDVGDTVPVSVHEGVELGGIGGGCRGHRVLLPFSY